jgi:hypothetical protein
VLGCYSERYKKNKFKKKIKLDIYIEKVLY